MKPIGNYIRGELKHRLKWRVDQHLLHWDSRAFRSVHDGIERGIKESETIIQNQILWHIFPELEPKTISGLTNAPGMIVEWSGRLPLGRPVFTDFASRTGLKLRTIGDLDSTTVGVLIKHELETLAYKEGNE